MTIGHIMLTVDYQEASSLSTPQKQKYIRCYNFRYMLYLNSIILDRLSGEGLKQKLCHLLIVQLINGEQEINRR